MNATAQALRAIQAPARPYICQRCLSRLSLLPRAGLPTVQAPHRRRALHTSPTTANDSDVIPLRKELKEAKRQRKRNDHSGFPHKQSSSAQDSLPLEDYELTVGLEIHAELNTATKLFSTAPTSSGIDEDPNTNVAPFDAALPGTQPSFQIATLIPAVRAALALGCDIQRRSAWDRKHYFYPDQPNGYQITQFYEPFAVSGSLVLHSHDLNPADVQGGTTPITIGIKQVQMEQDTAKTLQQSETQHLLDLNRVSHPLIEIITLPQIHSPSIAAATVRKIAQILKDVNACVVGMEAGGLRCDVNVSVRRTGSKGANTYGGVSGLGTRTEVKNIVSIKGVEDAIIAERDRQIRLLEAGETVVGETRRWAIGDRETSRLRGKEGEVDYRYMPDPDLAPLYIGQDLVEHLSETLPALTDELVERLTQNEETRISATDAKTMVTLDDGERVDFYLDVVHLMIEALGRDQFVQGEGGKLVANWVLHELGAFLTSNELGWEDHRLSSEGLATLLRLLVQKKITRRSAKHVFTVVARDGSDIETVIEEEGLWLQPMSEEEYIALAKEVLDENPQMVEQVVQRGQRGKLMWFVGQMVRRGGERVEAPRAEKALRGALGVS